MKKKVWLFVLACICCIAFAVAGCAGCADKAENISLSITNKEALTAEWLEEGENRTVELSITPEKYTVNNSEVVVTSDNSEVVKADGLTLLATGGGTANITVSLGKASDTVAITVTPKLRGVSITNKAELSEVWGLGDTDRTLDVAKLFKNSTAPLTASDVTVTSSAPEIIEADGFALKTKAIGDAEITVAYGDFTDKVSLSVVSALETFGITNKEELANLALGTTYDLSSYVTFSPLLYTAENTRPVITCEPAGIIEQVEGYQIKAASNGSATVTVTVRGKSDTFSVSVELGTPKITFDVDEVGARFEETDEGGILSVLQTGYYNELSDVVLPAVYATTSDGNYINDIVIKKGGDVITKDTVQLTIGRHELTYSVADPRDESKVATKTLIINVYRRVMQAGDKSDVKVTDETRYLSDDKQEFTTKTSGVLKGAFNIAPSKLYYAEVTFVVPTTQVFVGLGHFVGEETNRCFTIAVSRNTGVICVKDNKPNTGNIYENDIVQYNVNTKTNLKDKDGYVFPAIPSTVDGAKVKLAIARDGNKFYLFMNDVLLEERDITDVDNGHYLDASVPGISGQWLDKTTMTNIVFMSGEDATSKLAGLIPTPTINNKSAFSNPIDQNFKGKVEVSIAPEYYIGNTKVTYTSDNESAVTVGADGTVTPKANGEATITVAIGDKTDTVKITVELKADTPVLTLTPPADAENVKYTATAAGATLNIVQTGKYNENTTVTLPQVSASLDGETITHTVTTDLTISNNTVTLANGTYTITYTATNPKDSAKTTTKTLTINVARKVMKDDSSFKVTDETRYLSDDKQVVTATKSGVQGGAFNIAPGKLYYAEATFVFKDTDQLWIGLGHFVGNETDASRWMSCGVSRKTGAVCVKDRTAQTAGLYDKPFDGTLYNIKDRTTLTEQNGFLFPLDGTTMKAGDKVKLAIARDGNTFYFFMNDVLFEARDMSTYVDGYYSADTAPGFSGNDLNKTSITNIVFMDGDAVKNEIDKRLPAPAITNKSDFNNSIDQTFEGKVEVSITPNYYGDKTEVIYTSDKENVATVGADGTIKAIANGEAIITVAIGDKTDTVKITVKFKADIPVLTLTPPADSENVKYTATADGATLNVVQTGKYNENTTEVTLPQVSAMLGEDNITSSVTITLDGEATTLNADNIVTLTKGTHTIIYTVTNSEDSTKSAKMTLTINVARKVMKDDSSFKVTDETRYLSNDKQVVTVAKNVDVLGGAFNMAPSKLYYAEATFEFKEAGGVILGFGHFIENDTNRWLSCCVSKTTGNVVVKDHQSGNIYDNLLQSNTVIDRTQFTAEEGYTFLGIDQSTKDVKVKIAIARNENKFYLFINDVLLEERDMTGVVDGHYLEASVPGISGQYLNHVNITNIDFFGGEDATSKLAGLIPTPTINNKTAFSNPIDQTFEGKVEVSITPDRYNGKIKVTYTSDNESAVTVGADGTVTPKANGEATITVAIGDKTDTVKITVELKADTPVLTLTPPATAENVKYTATEAGATLDVVQTGRYNENTTVTLPQFSAILGEADISGDVSVTLDGKSTTLTGNTVTLANGTHTIIYTATNPENNKSATKTLTINIARKVMKDGTSFKVTDETLYSGDADQVVTATKNDVQGGAFNIAPSKLYYAEATFVFNTADQLWIGLGHFVGNETDASRWMSCGVSRKSGAVCVKDRTAQTAGLYDKPFDGTLYNVKDKTELTEQNGYLFPLEGKTMQAGDKVKLAIARDGNKFYFFMNDVLFEARDMSKYADSYYLADTAPGFSGNDLNKTSITNIVFMDGGEATEKINALTQTTQGDSETQNAAPAEQAVIPKKEEE